MKISYSILALVASFLDNKCHVLGFTSSTLLSLAQESTAGFISSDSAPYQSRKHGFGDGRLQKVSRWIQLSSNLICTYRTLRLAVPSWSDLEQEMGETYQSPSPISIDSVLQPTIPTYSSEHPTLFRERHGWCPYSERVWLTIELLNIPYDTILIDNTGGPRPSFYVGGQTPQMKWPETERRQGESMDLVERLDREYASFDFQTTDSNVKNAIAQFKNIFPSRARPSSRAAFLFQNNVMPLFRKTFEDTLQKTDQLLSEYSEGPFFLGDAPTAADIAWAPFLERYRYQLPALHLGLFPDDSQVYPHLTAWYQAMDQIPEYICRVKGNASSWRKVLLMAGFGNAGMVPPQITENIQDLIQQAEEQHKTMGRQSSINLDLWQKYAAHRPYVAPTPQAQVAQTICGNRQGSSSERTAIQT